MTILSNLPVQDNASFCYLNDQLKISQNKQATMKFLDRTGGKDVGALMKNMLRRIIADDVAAQYSMSAKQKRNSSKKQFITTETCQMIFEICKNKHEVASEKTLKNIASDWLNKAKIRLKKRERFE